MSATVLSFQAEAERAQLERAFPEAFHDGVRCGFLKTCPGERELGGYPRGFHAWPLEQRNAWFAGFNVGRVDRQRLHGGAP